MNDEILDINEEQINYENLAVSKGTRFGNAFADGIIAGIPISLFANYLVYGEWILSPEPRYLDLYFTSLFYNYMMYTLYYILMEQFTGKTIGKMMTGTHVINQNGEKASFGQIVGRSFARLIPFNALSFLFTKVGWHDSLSKTYVIQDK
jgi:uncharacterized RDD family membrane protein YckC